MAPGRALLIMLLPLGRSMVGAPAVLRGARAPSVPRRWRTAAASAAEPDGSLLDEATLLALEALAVEPDPRTRGMADSPSVAQASRMIAQLQLIQHTNASAPANIVVVGQPGTTTVLHQQIIELLSYALVLSGNRVLTTGSSDTDKAVIRGAMRADERMLTVVVPNVASAEPGDGPQLLRTVRTVVELRHADLSTELESQLVYAELLGDADRLLVFTSHKSRALMLLIEQAQALGVETCVLYLD
ncbi:hypothetical protein KFE25_005583 [Diacronema lutheri]|uniref:Uncharacterized protein n=1 Tax=Diacronema lutheri TaxID=2081491 RepID=A0A8J6CFU1_DIALT|nr:hypothetical protein KFE25_005583 [Diacronema lutheri]